MDITLSERPSRSLRLTPPRHYRPEFWERVYKHGTDEQKHMAIDTLSRVYTMLSERPSEVVA